MVAPSRPDLVPPAGPATGRLAAVQEMARLQRLLFEVEREFLRTAGIEPHAKDGRRAQHDARQIGH